MDFCINCIHFAPRESKYTQDPTHEFARCTRKGIPNPVSGVESYPYCNSERTFSNGTCAEGRHFQQKPENNNEQ